LADDATSRGPGARRHGRAGTFAPISGIPTFHPDLDAWRRRIVVVCGKYRARDAARRKPALNRFYDTRRTTEVVGFSDFIRNANEHGNGLVDGLANEQRCLPRSARNRRK
jgi:hypothetical protein